MLKRFFATLLIGLFVGVFISACVSTDEASATPPIIEARAGSGCGTAQLFFWPDGEDEVIGVYRAVFNSEDATPTEDDYIELGDTLQHRFDTFQPITVSHYVWYKVVTTGGTAYSGQVTTVACDFTQPTETTEPTPSAEPTETTEPTPSAEPTETTEPTPSAEPTETTEPTPSSEPTKTTELTPSSEPTKTTEPTPSAQARKTSDGNNSSHPTHASSGGLAKTGV